MATGDAIYTQIVPITQTSLLVQHSNNPSQFRQIWGLTEAKGLKKLCEQFPPNVQKPEVHEWVCFSDDLKSWMTAQPCPLIEL